MSALEELIARRLSGVAAYRPGRPAAAGPASGKLSSNESPFGPAPGVRAAVARSAGSVNRYPEQQRAVAALASWLGVDEARLVVTDGSDELCSLVATLLLGPGRAAVVGDPCYAIDATVSVLAGAELRRVPLADGSHDLAAMAEAAAGASVVWLPSPHNPTGVAVQAGQLPAFLEAVPADCLVVLDEAYSAFLEKDRRPDSLALAASRDNLLVQRTFSKDYAMAGLRIGYAVGSPVLAEALRRVRPPFSVTAPALAAMLAALDNPAWQEMTVARVRDERARLEAHLRQLGIEHYPSSANFVTARVGYARLATLLDGAGLSVRPGEDLGLPGWVRISVGWAPAMARLRAVLSELASAIPGDRATSDRATSDPATSDPATSDPATSDPATSEKERP